MSSILKTGLNPSFPLVSIAMCTYNGSAYLSEQLDSIIAQTYPNLEIIITDDASTDDTVTLLNKYGQKDSRIKILLNEKNIGYNKNFEKTIEQCSAEYIAISDQDDIWETDKIEVMMRLWPAGTNFVYSLSGTFRDEDFNNRKPAPDIVYTDIDDVHKLVFNSPVHGHASMFRKDLFPVCRPFPVDIYYDWWISMHAAATGRIGCIPQTLTWHRIHGNNSSRNITSIQDEQVRNKELRRLSIYYIESFCSRNLLETSKKDSLLRYSSLLRQLDGKRFSGAMFRYVLTNRKYIFHYKKPSPFLIFSNLKRAHRMAYKGLL